MSKKIVLLMLMFGLLLLGGGILLLFTSADFTTENKYTEKKETKEVTEYVENKSQNKSEALKQRHCLNSICIDELNVVTNNDINLSVVNADLKNISDQIIPEGYIKIVFTLNGTSFEKLLFHNEIPANSFAILEWQHNNKELINALDYSLVEPTAAEIIAEKQKQELLQSNEK